MRRAGLDNVEFVPWFAISNLELPGLREFAKTRGFARRCPDGSGSWPMGRSECGVPLLGKDARLNHEIEGDVA
ncbi:hypothetical protein AB4144_28355, partial [Rhizobiaceae sp. 2RAB30]